MTVAAISSIFVVMVAAQDQQQTGGGQPAGQQQDAGANNATGGGQTSTITIPEGAAAQQVQQYYQPDPAQVRPGSQVTWENQDSAPHTATADDGSFDTGNIAPGESGSATVQGQGQVPYHCTLHPFMTATLQVSGGGQQDSAQSQQGNATGQQNQTQAAGQQQVEGQSLEQALHEAGRLLTQAGNILQQAGGNQTATAGQEARPSSNATQAANATRTGGNQSQGTAAGIVSTIVIPQGASSYDADQFYLPDPARVHPGSQVTWENRDSVAHTATGRDGSFDTGSILAGESGSTSIEGQGKIDYYCTIHPHMKGTLNVVSAGQGLVDAAEQQGQTQTAQSSKASGAEQLQDLSPNELAQALEQIARRYQQAASALQELEGEQPAGAQQNETSVARNDSSARAPDTTVPEAAGDAAEINQTAAQQPPTQADEALLNEARQTVKSVIDRLENIISTR